MKRVTRDVMPATAEMSYVVYVEGIFYLAEPGWWARHSPEQ